MTTLSVVIPALNEEQGIEEISRRVLSVREGLNAAGVDELELLVVDDGSTDRTADIAASITGVTLVRHPQNRGYGAALQTGFSCAKGELIGFLDADGCPDKFSSNRDSDSDGIPDGIDTCPLDPENYNNFEDTNGCPDTISDATAGFHHRQYQENYIL